MKESMKEAKERLFSLAFDGNLPEMRSLLDRMNVENGERAELINAVSYGEGTILHTAAGGGRLPIIEWLLCDSGGRAAGFNKVLATTIGGQTALHIAVRCQLVEVFQAVVEGCKVENGERTAMINAVNGNGWTILHLAARLSCIPIISWILSDSGGRAAGFNKVLAKTTIGEFALHCAVSRIPDAFFAVVEGCKVENGERAAMLGDSQYNESILHYATICGSEDIVNWLLSEKGREAGFNPENLLALSKGNQSVLHLAVLSRFPADCLDRILSQCKNAEERSKLLFGADINGWTLLHYAVVYGGLPIVEWLVTRQQEERGGSNEDLFALTNDKKSALHRLAEEGSLEVFDFLLSRCNNTSERLRLFLGRDIKGWTIFHHAARCDRAEMIAHILRNFPDESKMIIDARDHHGMTALHRLIIGGLDEESREEFETDIDHRRGIRALLGFESIFDDAEDGDDYFEGSQIDDDEANDDKGAEDRCNNEEDHENDGRDNDCDDGDKRAIEEKKEVTIVAAGADPNVGLKVD